MEHENTPNLLHHPKFYFSFGDLIVQSAPDDDGTCTLFRVNKSILAFNSPVFAGMFTLPDAVTQDLYDGAPVVRVTDSVADLDALFSALHDPSTLSPQRFDPDIPLQLTAVMRLAKKYEIDTIRRRVVDVMHDNWPRTFEQWLRFQSELTVIKASHAAQGNGLVDGKSFEERIPEPASAIRFARDFDIPSILPFATCVLAGIPLAADWDAARQDSGSIRDIYAQRQSRSARWSVLDATDYRSLAIVKESFTEQIGKIFYDCTMADESLYECVISDDCRREPACVEDTDKIIQLWEDFDISPLSRSRLGDAMTHPDPLGLLEDLLKTRHEWGTCADCQDRMVAHLRELQAKIWEYLSQTVN